MATVALDQETLERMITDGLARDQTAAQIAQTIADLLVDGKAGKAISHPVRQEAIRFLREHGRASPGQIARHVDASLGTIAYHVRKLAELGVVELVGTAPRRGAVEHFYALTGVEAQAGAGRTEPPEGVTIAEAARIANVTAQSVRNWVKSGRVRVLDSGFPTLVSRSDVVAGPPPTGQTPRRNGEAPSADGVSLAQAAGALGVHEQTIRVWVRQDKLRAVPGSRPLRIVREDLDALLTAR